jgi:uncharacterized protein YndB with AHSA1/START domain
MSETREVKHKVAIDTTPELAFEALTKASELREWCSDEAWTQARVGGRYDLRWSQGYRSDGQFVELEPPHRAVVTWQGTGEPGQTKVEFVVKPVEGGVKVIIRHSGFGPDAKWDGAVEASEKGWSTGVENLKSTLETGVDLRLIRRPFLGITLDVLTPERAKKEGIAAERGILVLGAVEGSGAEAAGIGPGDVIVSLGGMETPAYQELGDALAARQSGDVVDVALVRGQERETIRVTLGIRSQPEVPATAGELADRMAEGHEEANAALVAALVGVTDEEATQSPAKGEWSVKQVLAHLSSGERGFHNLLVNWAVNGWLDGSSFGPDAIPGQLEAALAVTPTLQGMLDRYLADVAETVALIRYLPDETVAHRARFRRIAEAVSYGPSHTREHVEQIKNTVASVRGG